MLNNTKAKKALLIVIYTSKNVGKMIFFLRKSLLVLLFPKKNAIFAEN